MNSNRLVRKISTPVGFTITSAILLMFLLGAYRSFGIEQDLSASGDGLFNRSLVYGLCVAVSSYAWESILGAHRYWLKRILQWLFSLLLCFLALNYFWLGQDWRWSSFFSLSIDITLFWLIPLGLDLAIRQFILKANPSNVDLTPISKTIVLQDESGKKEWQIEPPDFLFATADGNYVDVHIIRDEKDEVILLRQSLKVIENQNPDLLLRVHRKYLVGIHSIAAVKWHSKEAKLRLKNGVELKVGQTYQESLRRAWKQRQS